MENEARPALQWLAQAMRSTAYARIERRIIERLDPQLRLVERPVRERIILDRLAEYGGCDE